MFYPFTAAAVQVAFGHGQASNFMRSYGPPKGAGASASISQGSVLMILPSPSWNLNSGNPVLLDEKEFGDASTDMTYNDDSTNSAIELGLMEQQEEPKMIFFQLPTSLPLVKRSATAEDNQKTESSGPSNKCFHSLCFPLGFLNNSVSPGSDCVFARDVVAMNTEEKHCCTLGLLDKRAIITPNVDSLLDRINMD
ncbi:hypothetical protein NE237_016549 [Protea cynaroides]|uniref:Uncharacterized protein n=1 Tax=Protea cynaroides TaxID=273540 RepID=A0A9Q0K6V0_9MAGN|nr:hypothetical protein NE237_016549 [Protea cynaroides]